MSRSRSRSARALVRLVVVPLAVLLALPAAAQAWQVTVRVHGAGKVVETTPRGLMDCVVSMTGTSESSVYECEAGTPDGVYNSGDIVGLAAGVPTDHHARGWRFDKWVDGDTGSRINCDPQGTTGDHSDPNCRFQIFRDLDIDLYFVDVTGPQDTEITSKPLSVTNATIAYFGFRSPSEADALFECQLTRPGGQTSAWEDCGTPLGNGESYSTSSNGSYTFRVRAKDLSGNLDLIPATHTWRVDTVAPTVHMTGVPAEGSTTSETSLDNYSVVSSEWPDATVVCSLDDEPAPCSGTKAGLADGTHTLAGRSTDEAGNTGPAVTRTWTVDTVAPDTTIGPGGPAEGSTRTVDEAVLAFSSPDGTASFECRLDDDAFAPCTSPVGLTGLDEGPHAFEVRARDAADNVDAEPARRSWSVDTIAPRTTVTAGPVEGAATSATSATLGWTSTDAAASFECSLDGAAFVPCASPHVYAGLAPGAHTFAVRGRDAAGNVESPPAVRAWTVAPPPHPPAAPVVPVPPAIAPPLVAGTAGERDTRLPAKLKVRRAGVKDGALDILAEMTNAANGDDVEIAFESAGRTFTFTETVKEGRLRVDRDLPTAQRRVRSGIVTYRYAGSERVRPTEVRLRAASGRSRMARTHLSLDDGVLKVEGTISSRARGIVRFSLEHLDAAGRVAEWHGRTSIRKGKWSLSEALPPAAAAGGYLTIQFTGYRPRGLRGEQDAKQVP